MKRRSFLGFAIGGLVSAPFAAPLVAQASTDDVVPGAPVERRPDYQGVVIHINGSMSREQAERIARAVTASISERRLQLPELRWRA